MKTKITAILSLALMFIFAAPLRAADAKDPKMDDLQKRFKERYPAIQDLKAKGLVGETDKGMLDWVDKVDPKSPDIVDQENSDRTKLYDAIAKKEGTSVEEVAKHAAQRNFQKAKTGEFLQVNGKWHKKEG